MYQALYRKWRPLVFSDVVGQRHVTDTLKSELLAGLVSHAYLFTGTRGTGKTTCAKILARAVNCGRPDGGDPCNECPACRGILSGSVLDVTEMDAASYTGVDNIRALRDELEYVPVSVRMRVYIIDEVHMLSPSSFNALLSVLEEPPPHVLFILATTEIHKVPATIQSRCQRFTFRRIPPREITAQLMRVARGEGIELDDEAARILTRLSDGALRDALSLLDQCASATGGQARLDAASVYSSLGMAGLKTIVELSSAIAARDAGGALALVRAQYESGRELSSVLDELCLLLRDLLLSEYQPDGPLLSGLESGDVRKLAESFGRPRLLYAITQLQETQMLFARGGSKRVDMELCLIRLCDERLSEDLTGLTARVARLEGCGVPATEPKREPATEPKREPAAEPKREPAPEPRREPAAEPKRGSAADRPGPAKPPPSAGLDWQGLLDSLGGDINFMIRALLNRARVRLDGNRLTIGVGQPELKHIRDNALMSLVGTRAGAMLGFPVEVVVTTGDGQNEKREPDPLDLLIQRGGGVIQIKG